MVDKMTGKDATELVKKIETAFKGLPHLPKGVVDFLVAIAPWAVGLAGVMSIVSGLGSLVATGRQNALWMALDRYAGVNSTYFTIAGIFTLVLGALYLMAFSPLKAHKMTGWMYLFWANVLGIIQSVLGVVFGFGGIVGTVIGAAIGLYFLFEVKPRYK